MSYTPNIDEEFENSIRGDRAPETVKNTSPQPPRRPAEDIDSVLKIFNTPEYRTRRESVPQEPAIQTQSFQNAHGTVSNINTRELKRKKKRKLTNFGKGSILVTTAAILLLLMGARFNMQTTVEPVEIPDGYVQVFAREQVEHGESVYSIASEYYNQQIYGEMYENLNDFVDIIIESNHLTRDGAITPYDTLTIPVLVDVDNPCYQELKNLEAQIKKIKEEAYWVDYVVNFGDSLSSIAAKASGSDGETISLVNQIMEKNKLSNSLIYAGQELKIVNPALGQLKINFNEIQDALFDSLKLDNNQK